MKAQYKALIIDTILKEVRSKTLIFIFAATTIAIILGHLALSAFSAQMGGEGAISITGIDILSLNFRILNSIGFIIAAVFGVSVLRSDFENNIIYQYLAFPISRAEYYFIRVLGTWLLVVSYYAYSYLLSSVLFSFALKKIVITPAHFYSFLVLCLYLLIVIFMAIFFSLLMNKIGALFATFASFIASAAAYSYFSALSYKDIFLDFGLFKGVGLIFYYLFPRISFLDSAFSNILSSKEPMSVNVAEQVIHLVIISGLYVYLANYFVKRKDF